MKELRGLKEESSSKKEITLTIEEEFEKHMEAMEGYACYGCAGCKFAFYGVCPYATEG